MIVIFVKVVECKDASGTKKPAKCTPNIYISQNNSKNKLVHRKIIQVVTSSQNQKFISCVVLFHIQFFLPNLSLLYGKIHNEYPLG